jgi:imidazolonepropionase
VPRDLLITGCAQLLTLRGSAPKRGSALNQLNIIRDGALLVHDGRIAAVGPRRALERKPQAKRARRLNVGGRVVLPGFVDSHTHLVFPASRANDYERRIGGATYEQIARAGGGILSTVTKLRRAPAHELEQKARGFLRGFAAHGTTTVEAKSGYGLSGPDELKTLIVLQNLKSTQPLDIVPTFLGAHIVPPEFKKRPDAYVDFLIHKLIPQVAGEGLAEFCDVFCDRGAFTVEQARHILTAGRACGLVPRIHAEQLARTGAARLAIELHAASADHLEKLSAADIRALGKSDVACTLLPGCCLHLGHQHYPPARKLIESGAIVALATDFNPGTSPTLNMQMVLTLACTQMRMSPAEAIAAATINAAYALRRHDRVGSLEVSKFVDITVFDVEDYREIPYYFGWNHCWMTLKRGKVVWAQEPSNEKAD